VICSSGYQCRLVKLDEAACLVSEAMTVDVDLDGSRDSLVCEIRERCRSCDVGGTFRWLLRSFPKRGGARESVHRFGPTLRRILRADLKGIEKLVSNPPSKSEEKPLRRALGVTEQGCDF
jgi:hypothetical protein